ncbi:hypothetical protein LINPERPRIM_LOCUS34050, partial [Linum perenne]
INLIKLILKKELNPVKNQLINLISEITRNHPVQPREGAGQGTNPATQRSRDRVPEAETQ